VTTTAARITTTMMEMLQMRTEMEILFMLAMKVDNDKTK